MSSFSVVDFSSLFSGLDMAAEHYHPDKLECLGRLSRAGHPVSYYVRPVRQLVKPSLNDEIPVFDLGAASNHILHLANAQIQDRISTKKICRNGDVIISRLRSYLRQIAIVPPDINRAYLSTEFIVLRSKDKTSAAFLLPFFLSACVQTVLAWSQDGNEHPRFNEKLLLDLFVPPVVESMRDTLSEKVSQATRCYSRASVLYAEASEMLEVALGLDKLDLAPRLTYERHFTDVQAGGRFDAEYYQPRMQNLISALSRDKLTIGDVARLSKRRFRPIPTKEYQYIEISDVSGHGTAGSSPILGEEAPSRATWLVMPGDIITTTVRPIRRLSAIINEDQSGYVCSSGFAVLTPKNNLSPELLLTYLRLPLVCELLDLNTTASMYPAISTTDLMNIPILIPEITTAQEIVDKVRESFGARQQAQQMLEEATTIVDKAI